MNSGAHESANRIAALNEDCFCFPMDRSALDAHIQSHLEHSPTRLPEHLFANTGVLISAQDLNRMLQVVTAVEATTDLADYRRSVFERNRVNPDWHNHCVADVVRLNGDGHSTGMKPGGHGLFMGYDFHITEVGPALIEVNTNAGGAFLVDAMLDVVRRSNLERACAGAELVDFGASLVDTFVAEWRAGIGLQAGADNSSAAEHTPNYVVIADNEPSEQYLFPDMLLAQRTLSAAGIACDIVDVSALREMDGALYFKGRKIDLLYNRSTDFYFRDPGSESLRRVAQLAVNNSTLPSASAGTVISPNPTQHALFADKRNLMKFGSRTDLQEWGLAANLVPAVKFIPAADAVDAGSADHLWAKRRQLFFKPATGFGSRAVYRGDKITKKVWRRITDAAPTSYVAQTLVPPGKRGVVRDSQADLLKYDVRLFTYAGRPLLAAARVYQGQTTNFRTIGGGFAPLFRC